MSVEKLVGEGSLAGPGRQAKRFWLACALVAALAVLLVSNSAYEAVAGPGSLSADERNVAALAGVDAVLDGASDDPFALASELPSRFETELFSLSGMDDARCSPDLRLLGYSQPGSAEDALRALAEKLEGKGWEVIPSEQALCRSFSKTDGTYRWAFASAAQVGGSASVVVQWSGVQGGDK